LENNKYLEFLRIDSESSYSRMAPHSISRSHEIVLPADTRKVRVAHLSGASAPLIITLNVEKDGETIRAHRMNNDSDQLIPLGEKSINSAAGSGFIFYGLEVSNKAWRVFYRLDSYFKTFTE